MNIIIIPARGGSKRLPKKNTLLLNGLPLIEYSINYALANTHIVDKIYVSTDDNEIKRIAKNKGVDVIDRPEHLSGDDVPSIAVLKHVLEAINITVDNVILLQPTNPFRPKTLLREAYKTFIDGNYDSLMSVTRNSQKFGKIQDGKFLPFNYEIGQRSQDLEPLYFENGLLYINKASIVLKGKMIGDNNVPFILDHPYAHIDIDTDYEFKFANFVLKNYPLD